MRKTLLIILLLTGLSIYSQIAVLKGTIRDSTESGCASYSELKFLKNDTTIYTESFCNYRITLTKYLEDTIIVTNYALGMIKVPFKLKDKQMKELDIHFPQSCKYLLKTDICPKCFSNQNAIKITYGLPVEKRTRKKWMRLSKRGKMHLGGCMINDCSPQHYCKKDKIEF